MLASGMVERAALLEALRAALEGSGVELALLFGSEARGAAREGSDVDVAVSGNDVDRLTLAARLSSACGREVDVVPLETASIPLVGQLLRDAVVIFEGTPGAAASWRARAWLMMDLDGPLYARMRDAWLARVAERGV